MLFNEQYQPIVKSQRTQISLILVSSSTPVLYSIHEMQMNSGRYGAFIEVLIAHSPLRLPIQPSLPSLLPINHLPPFPLCHRPPFLPFRHLRQPRRRPHPRLLMNRLQQRRQPRHKIPNRPHPTPVPPTPPITSIPTTNLRLQPLDRARIRLCQFLKRVVPEHDVLQQALRPAEDVGHVTVGGGHFGEGFGFLFLGEEGRFGFGDDGFGVLTLGVEGCFGGFGGAEVWTGLGG